MTFFISCDPPKSLSKNSKVLFTRNGFPGMTDSKSTANSKSTILQLFAPHMPAKPFEGPLKLSLYFFYPFPKSTSKKELALGSRPMVVKPDVDGIASGVLDCMTTLRFWQDDAQVYCLRVDKFQSETCGIRVEILEWEGRG